MSVSICPANTFSAMNKPASQLVNQFCMCPAAKEMIINRVAEIINPLFVNVADVPFVKTEFSYFDYSLQDFEDATIFIPKKLTNGFAISGLAFEVFNCLRGKELQQLDNESLSGKHSMDVYARKAESLEYKASISHDRLLKKCAKFWNIPKDAVSGYSRASTTKDRQIHIWESDFMCHTDVFRATWVKLFQKQYCDKNLQDERSCKIKEKDLCDYSVYESSPLEEQVKIYTQRVCSGISTAPKKVQDYFKNVVRGNCPNALIKKGQNKPAKKIKRTAGFKTEL